MNQTFSSLTVLGALILASTAHAQSTRSLSILNGGDVGLSCDIGSLPTASIEVQAELRAVQAASDRMMCLRDGVAFATDMDGEVRVSVLAPMADGALGITDHYLTQKWEGWGTWLDDIAAVSVGAGGPLPCPIITATDSASGVVDQFSDVCDAGTALDSADGRRLGWSEICDAGTALTLGGQEGEPVRAILDAMVAFTNAPDSMYIDDASSNYTESRDEGLVYGALCNNELISGAQRPDDGLLAVVIITALIDDSN